MSGRASDHTGDPGPGQVLFAFVRHWSRRSRSGTGGIAAQGRLVEVTQAVAAVIDRPRAPTVNAVAGELGIDQSGASRLIAAAVEAGYLTMTAAAGDGRRRQVGLTPVGRRALEQARSWQEQVFAELTLGWTDRRRDDFRRAMTDLLGRSDEMA